MVAQGKGMAGTVVWGAKVWTGPSHPAKSRDRSPKNEVFSLWFLYTLTPNPMAPSSPFLSRDMAGGKEADFLSGPISLFPSSCLG